MLNKFSLQITAHYLHLAAGSPLTPKLPTDLNNTPTSLGGVASKVTNLLMYIIGITSVIMIIVGGFMYVTSAGNPDRAKTARATITSAVIGVILALLAFSIVHFVLSNFQ